jgi:hypothetical protein
MTNGPHIVEKILGMIFSHFVGDGAFQSPQKRFVAPLITSFGVEIFSNCWRCSCRNQQYSIFILTVAVL